METLSWKEAQILLEQQVMVLKFWATPAMNVGPGKVLFLRK
jgi:hypothetical protein